MIVLEMDNAWNMGIIKIMHLCSAHTVCCARKVKRNFRPAHRLKMTSPTGFTYVGHAEAIKKSKLYTYTHTRARAFALSTHDQLTWHQGIWSAGS